MLLPVSVSFFLSVPGIAFDLNAVGDEDDDGQMQQIYKEGSDGQVDVDEVDRRSVYVGNVSVLLSLL